MCVMSFQSPLLTVSFDCGQVGVHMKEAKPEPAKDSISSLPSSRPPCWDSPLTSPLWVGTSKFSLSE